VESAGRAFARPAYVDGITFEDALAALA